MLELASADSFNLKFINAFAFRCWKEMPEEGKNYVISTAIYYRMFRDSPAIASESWIWMPKRRNYSLQNELQLNEETFIQIHLALIE